MSVRILVGDALATLREMPERSVRCCVTSPPYWGLRDYGVAGQLGLEATPDAYVAAMVEVFREVRRALSDDGTLWLNLGDSYSANRGYQVADNKHRDVGNSRGMRASGFGYTGEDAPKNRDGCVNADVPPKNLVGIPWRVAFALQADGWYLRSDIIWAKPNPMPESVTDRPTKAHEYVFLLSKSERYFYDADAIAEDSVDPESLNGRRASGYSSGFLDSGQDLARTRTGFGSITPGKTYETRNARTVWNITTRSFKEAHFATFPPELPRRCILAGSAKGDTILDPFGGAGTTGLVADRLGRNAVLIELNPKYAAMAERRIHNDAPLFAEVSNA